MDLVKHKPGNVQSVLGSDFRRKHLVESRVLVIDDPLCRPHDLGALHQRRGHLHHLLCHIENDAGLLSVRSRAVDLSGRLVIGIEHVERDSRRKL